MVAQEPNWFMVEQGPEQSCASGSTPLPTTKFSDSSDFSSKDLEGIRIFLIFTKTDSGMFVCGGSPYSPDLDSSPLNKLE